jgi:UDP-N-acetylmuramoyl-L-alanyl-D-glutamate--2,6-diaminopimelate ligase
MMAIAELNQDKQLMDLIPSVDPRFASIKVTGIQFDSRQVQRGDLFLACAGHNLDGRKFINQAIAAGAVAVLVEKDQLWSDDSIIKKAPLIVVEDLPARLSEIAGQFYDHPSKQMTVVGVTGTNGKTSCTQLMMQLYNRLKQSCGVIGTLGVGLDGHSDQAENTTPHAVTIQQLLAQWHSQQVPVAVMEASSHGLEQGRVAAVQFELALFTNLSRDHLDYHGSMQSYAEAKALLFQQPGLKTAVLNADDKFSSSLQALLAADVKPVSYSVKKSLTATDFWLENCVYHADGVSAQLHTPNGIFTLNSPLLGEFNLSNAVAVIACLSSLGITVAELVSALASVEVIPGRMQNVATAGHSDIAVVVDYAHTPDALEKALSAMRQHCQGHLWCVFGCGGDRDQGKRPQMGAIAQRFADHVVVTSDNPRSEPASDIINEILGGVDRPSLIEEDRAIAIATVIAKAAPGDAVLIAGKGHEDYQLIGKQRLPFSDLKQARLALAQRAANSSGATP